MNSPSCAAMKTGPARERRAADRDAVVEGRRHAQLREVRTRDALGGRQPFVEAAGVDQRGQALARRHLREAGVHGVAPVMAATAWSSRRPTTAGVAPMSLIDTPTPARPWRSWKSRSTASQIRTEAARRRLDRSIRQPVPGTSLDQHLEVARGHHADQHRRERRPARGRRRTRNAGIPCRPSRALRSPVAEAARRPVEAARRAHQIAHRAGGQQVARGVARVDAEVRRAPDHAARAQPSTTIAASRRWPTGVKPATPRIACSRSASLRHSSRLAMPSSVSTCVTSSP